MFKSYWFIVILCECIHVASCPVLRPVFIGTYNLDLLVKTDQVEYGVNNLTSIPAVASADFIYLKTASYGTDLYGFNDIMFNEIISPLISIVF